MYCKLPHSGLTIQPNGALGVCCAQNMDWDFGHISDTADIYDAWLNHKNMINLKNDIKSEISAACSACLNYKEISFNRWHKLNNVNYSSSYTSTPIDGKIRYLEFTTSNICNQACATCSSFYSTKWIPIEQEALEIGLPLDKWKKEPGGFNSFGHKYYRMTDEDIQKIFKILPDLRILCIKGGEPFADDKNYKVLKELARVNPECRVDISSNAAKIPQKYLEILKNISFITLSCSIDGINETYEYIRSTSFNQTIDNIKKWKDADLTGSVSISYTVSVYNFYHTPEFLLFFNENLLEEIKKISISNWVRGPRFLSAASLFEESKILEQIEISENLDLREKRFDIECLRNRRKTLFEISDTEKIKNIEKFHKYTQFMNYKRGINIYDLHPQLLNI